TKRLGRLRLREASHEPQGFSPWMKAQKQKRINLYSVKGAWRLDQSKIIALAFSLAAEIERDLISQLTKEALRFKKAQGMKLGRPTAPAKRKLDPYRPEIENLLAMALRKIYRPPLRHNRGQSSQSTD